MKAITCDMILTSASTRADGSLGLRFSTPELDPSSKTAFFELLNQNLKVLLQPTGEVEGLKDVKGEFENKTPSQRLRNCLFVAFRQSGARGEFDDFYRKKMEVFINDVKSNLQPE